MEFSVTLDLPALLTAVFAAVACALLGNYLVLRGLSLMGDAISHAVLPGIVVAFLLTSSRSGITIFIGAAVAGILSAAIIEFVRKYGRVESGAAMGVVFSIFFALGILFIEQAAARSVDLDADCLLHGQLETIFWYPPPGVPLLSREALALLPSEVMTSFLTLVVVIGFVLLFYKELKLSSFDSALADALGFRSSFLHQMLMVMVACAVVASFKAVGSILVIAMLICPAASARLWTDRYNVQIILSVVFAILSCVLGYFLGAFGPLWLGYKNSVSAAGMMAVVSGLLLTGSIILAPRHGVLARSLRQLKLAVRVRGEDILALIYRAKEVGKPVNLQQIRSTLGDELLTTVALLNVKSSALVVGDEELSLSTPGEARAKELVRSHRLWESYLVQQAALSPDHVHDIAERLEHVTAAELQEKVATKHGEGELDPHGKPIP